MPKMFKTTTGILTWMSHPAQPSFVWQLYHYDLEPNASLYAAKKAAEKIHVQLNESNGAIQIVNNTPDPLANLSVHATIYDFDSKLSSDKTYPVAQVAGSTTVKAAQIEVPARILLHLLRQARSHQQATVAFSPPTSTGKTLRRTISRN